MGSRVDVHYPRDQKWWTGVVLHSWIYRPRSSSLQPERRIVVKYDDPRYSGETFEHGLNNSEVRLHSQRARGAPRQRYKEATSSTPQDEKTQRRLARLTRQLALDVSSSGAACLVVC